MAKRVQTKSSSRRSFETEAAATARHQRQIQSEVDRSGETETEEKEPAQTGARAYPVSPLPKQHLKKPGLEADLDLQPMYAAPAYKGSDKLEGRVALITGGDSGIGRSVAVLFAREGADIAIAYLDEHGDAQETKEAVEQEGRRCIALSGDVADPAFCRYAVERRWPSSANSISSSTTRRSRSISTVSRS